MRGESGAVCDVSVLVGRESFGRAQQLVAGELYLPSATYSWLARDKLIAVRGEVLGYSLVSQFVRDGELLVVYLPELYDEIARRLLFEVEREVPLTDLRAVLMAAHLGLPLLALDNGLVEGLREHLGARSLWRLDSHPDRLVMGEALGLYRELSRELGSCLGRRICEDDGFGSAIEELVRSGRESAQNAVAAVQRLGQAKANPGGVSLEYLAWDLTRVAREYVEQHVLQPEIVRKLCSRALLLVASPK